MRTFFAKWFDRIFACLGAFLFCQLPLFIHQYLLLLAGHREESKLQFDNLQNQALASGKTLPAYIQKFLSVSDPDYVQMGQWMLDLQARTDALNRAYTALQEASLWTKPFIFFAHVDRQIFSETVAHFTPGVPTSIEGVVYAGIGLCIGIAVFKLFTMVLRPKLT